MIPQAIHREGEADEGFGAGRTSTVFGARRIFRAKTSSSCKRLSARLVLRAAA